MSTTRSESHQVLTDSRSLRELMEGLVADHRELIRPEVTRLCTLVEKALATAGPRYQTVLHALQGELARLDADMGAHIAREEDVLFVLIRCLLGLREQGCCDSVQRLSIASRLQHEHENAMDLLGRLRRVTGNYKVPKVGGEVVSELYDGLVSLDAVLCEHVFLEDSVLIPSLLSLAGVEAAT